MTSVKDETRTIRVCVVSIALSIAFGSGIDSLERLFSAKPESVWDDGFLQADGRRQTVDDHTI
jgi:hypothetical protein